ncbi:dihydroxyacetone kinase subunit DhaK [Novosphingobium profundi]|uniref:dihydroxyacetone kinase family protein n=1 Tax=Novosphingobium profundi TaxID=1774954 RepID=UPI001BDB01AB|nr:dihydroxyacetone kinase family protein [Novosphingobium profundi]MBT0668160.1 dihydroxyacetone kinase subunit DhaK [Novosphingobium profundi]
MKKLINSPATLVPDMLAGLAMSDDRLALLPAHDVIVRADYQDLHANGQVALISGGGAGHEPAHAGYVGKGMLTAAVTGAVFTSPSVDAVLAAIRLVTGPAGCLLIVKNYTGDRLNFGLAAAIARSEGLAVEMVLVDDDVALDQGHSRAGARGLAGTVLVHKVAGAAAAAGRPLGAIVSMLQDFIAGIGTMGVSLAPCINPSAGVASFELGPDEIEYGLGIHGERGLSREANSDADTVASRLVSRIVEAKGFGRDERVVLMVNGLGGTPPAEIAIVLGSALNSVRMQGLRVERVVSGSLLTALEMAGCSISLARANDGLIEWIDAASDAPAWPRASRPAADMRLLEASATDATHAGDATGALAEADQALLAAAIERVAWTLIAAEADLTDLDRIVGDGDLGISLERGARAVLEARGELDMSHPAPALQAVSNILRRAIGGTSGPLYAAFTLAVSASLRDAALPLRLSDWAAAMAAGCEAITRLGGAREGDCTMLDALLPASAALSHAARTGETTRRALADAAQAASHGAERTAMLAPQLGRASYLGEIAVGQIDPGAMAVSRWLDAIEHVFS